MAFNTVVEILATLAGLAFIILLIRDRVICWPFGIVGSLLSIYLFVDGKLYLNYSSKIQKKWEQDIPGYIGDADLNWPKILADH